jgi:hypothetical protein
VFDHVAYALEQFGRMFLLSRREGSMALAQACEKAESVVT